MRIYPSRGAVMRGIGAVAFSVAVAVTGAAPTASAAPTPPSAREVAAAQARLDALAVKTSAAVEEYNAARLRLAALRRTADAASRRADAARRAFEAKRARLTAYAVSAYQSDGSSGLAVVLDGTPADYLDRISLLHEVSHRQAEIVREVDAARIRYVQEQTDARHALARAEATVTRIAAVRASIVRQVGAQQRILSGLRATQARLIAAGNAAAASRVAQVIDSGAVPAGPQPAPPPVSGGAAAVVQAAYSVLGRPYLWGASGPGSFDCSGLTSYAWARAGVSLPHSAAAQFGSGRPVARTDLRPGDLVFFYSPISHVGIYIGNGQMIDAPRSGTVVGIRAVYWDVFVGAVRPG